MLQHRSYLRFLFPQIVLNNDSCRLIHVRGGEEEAMAEPFPGLKIAAPERTPQQGEVRPPPPPPSFPASLPPPTSGSGCLPSLAPPRLTWRARQVVIRYEVREPKVGCCQCSDMNQSGLIALVALIFVCWPLACIPCCMKSCHESYQVPVFGPPAYQPPVCPFVAPPAQGIPTTGKGS